MASTMSWSRPVFHSGYAELQSMRIASSPSGNKGKTKGFDCLLAVFVVAALDVFIAAAAVAPVFVAVEMFALSLLSCLLLHSAAGAGLCKVVVFGPPSFVSR